MFSPAVTDSSSAQATAVGPPLLRPTGPEHVWGHLLQQHVARLKRMGTIRCGFGTVLLLTGHLYSFQHDLSISGHDQKL